MRRLNKILFELIDVTIPLSIKSCFSFNFLKGKWCAECGSSTTFFVDLIQSQFKGTSFGAGFINQIFFLLNNKYLILMGFMNKINEYFFFPFKTTFNVLLVPCDTPLTTPNLLLGIFFFLAYQNMYSWRGTKHFSIFSNIQSVFASISRHSSSVYSSVVDVVVPSSYF